MVRPIPILPRNHSNFVLLNHKQQHGYFLSCLDPTLRLQVEEELTEDTPIFQHAFENKSNLARPFS